MAADARSIVHRDISPQNVMITPEGFAKVTDFGVSRDLTQNTMTATSMLMGKPLYIAPEVATGASKADIRADIYALGVILFQMVAGRVPFDAPTPFGVMQQHVRDAVPAIHLLRPGVPAWLQAVIDLCLAKQPAQRFQGATVLLKALEAGRNETTVHIIWPRARTYTQSGRNSGPACSSAPVTGPIAAERRPARRRIN